MPSHCPSRSQKNEKTHIVYMSTAKAEGLIASDQTGMFPRTSNRGNKYICIFYVYDANFINARCGVKRVNPE